MIRRDIVVIGASTGGVEAIPKLLATLPADLEATVFVVMHLSAASRSFLPMIINKVSPLTADHPRDGEKFKRGMVYVAPPDQHLILRDNTVRLVRGPKENRHRPAIDPLFRSAAKSYGQRVIGVILTGALDDGSQGLRIIKQCGGKALVQSPEEAHADSMPLNALRAVEVDFCVPVAEMGPLIAGLTKQKLRKRAIAKDCAAVNWEPEMEDELTLKSMTDKMGAPSGFICPECQGPLWETKYGPQPHFRCLVGHAFSPESLLADGGDNLERSLWVAVENLEERSRLLQKLAERCLANKQEALGKSFAERAKQNQEHAAVIREMLKKARFPS